MKRFSILLAILLIPGLAHAQNKFGFFPLNATPNLCVNFFNTSGASADPTGTATVDIYEEDTATEIVDNASMSKFDSKTGYFCYKPTLSSGIGFEVGKRYQVTATCDSSNSCAVDGVTVTSYEFMTFQVVAGTSGYFAPDWSAINAPTTTVTLSGTTVKNATDVLTSLQSSLAVKKATSFEWPMKFVSSSDHRTPVTGATPSCTRSIDSPNSFSATTNSASVTTAFGLSELTLSTSDMNGTYFTILRCTATNADPYESVFKIQVP